MGNILSEKQPYISKKAEIQNMINSGELNFNHPTAPPQNIVEVYNYDQNTNRRLMRALSNNGDRSFIKPLIPHANLNMVNLNMEGVFRLLHKLKYYDLIVDAIKYHCTHETDWLFGLCLMKSLTDAEGKQWNIEIMTELAKVAPPIPGYVHQMILDARYNASQKTLKGKNLIAMENEYMTLLAIYKSLYSN